MNVGGANGKYLFCPGYALGECTCQTQVRRDLAESMILDAIAQKLLDNPDWMNKLLERATASFERLLSELPSDLRVTQDALKTVESRLDYLLRNCESGVIPELGVRIEQIKSERNLLRARASQFQREATELLPAGSR
jgi:hypothetical protein